MQNPQNSLESLPTPEQTRETQLKSAEDAPERRFDTPESVQELRQESVAEIDDNAAQTLAAAESRVSAIGDNTGLGSEKAAAVYERYGFSSRVDAVREEMSALGEETKKKIDSVIEEPADRLANMAGPIDASGKTLETEPIGQIEPGIVEKASPTITRSEFGQLREVPEDFFIKNQDARQALSDLASRNPEIADVAVVPLGKVSHKESHPGGEFQWGPKGKMLRLPEFNKTDLEEIMKLEGPKQAVARELKIAPEAVTEEMLTCFIIAHEVGHAASTQGKTLEGWLEEKRREEGKKASWRTRPHKERTRLYRELPHEKLADEYAFGYLNQRFREQ